VFVLSFSLILAANVIPVYDLAEIKPHILKNKSISYAFFKYYNEIFVILQIKLTRCNIILIKFCILIQTKEFYLIFGRLLAVDKKYINLDKL